MDTEQDELTPEPEHEEDREVEEKEYNKRVEPVFPIEFIDTISITAFDTVSAYLKKMGIPQEVITIIDEIIVLHLEIEHILKGNGMVRKMDNDNMLDVVPFLTRMIAKYGGSFHCAGSYSSPRQTDLTDSAKGQIEDILRRADAQGD